MCFDDIFIEKYAFYFHNPHSVNVSFLSFFFFFFTKIIAGFAGYYGAVTYDIFSMVVALDAATVKTTACTLLFFALCSYQEYCVFMKLFDGALSIKKKKQFYSAPQIIFFSFYCGFPTVFTKRL